MEKPKKDALKNDVINSILLATLVLLLFLLRDPEGRSFIYAVF